MRCHRGPGNRALAEVERSQDKAKAEPTAEAIDPAQAYAASCNASMRGLADAGLKAELRVMRSHGGLAAPGTVADLTGEATISPRREMTGTFRSSTNPTTANWLSRCLTDVGLELVETTR